MPSKSTVMCSIRALTLKRRSANQIQCDDNLELIGFGFRRIASILSSSQTMLSLKRRLPRLKKASRASPTLRAARFLKTMGNQKYECICTDIGIMYCYWYWYFIGIGCIGYQKFFLKLTWMFLRFYLFLLQLRQRFSMLQSSLKVSKLSEKRMMILFVKLSESSHWSWSSPVS